MNSVKTASFHGVQRNEVYLKYLPKPDYLQYQAVQGTVTLITNEGSALTEKVYQSLKAKGRQVVVLNLPNQHKPVAEYQYSLNAYNDLAVKTAIANIEQQYGTVSDFIHLHPHFEFKNGQFAQHFETERSIVKTVFLLAKYLQKSLNTLGEQGRSSFLTITRMDGQLGLGKRSNTSVVGGGLNGLTKCLNLEWSSVYCRAVDIQPEIASSSIAEHIVAALYDPNRSIIETAISKEGRYTLAARTTNLQEHRTIETTVTNKDVFVVSGGARGVTANCVIEMAKTFGCSFVLLGRSDYDFELPNYALNTQEEGLLKRSIMQEMKDNGEKPNLAEVKSIYNKIVAKIEIKATIEQIEAAGSNVKYIKGDVTKKETIQAQLDLITQKWGPVTGIIHGAGRLADKYIQDKTEQDFHNVLTVKLDGLLSLFQCVNIHQLDHLILFSSVAGFYGNVGQTDYAIANEILSKAAHQFKTNHPNTKVSAINWGAWDAGMVSDALKKKFKEMGVVLVNSKGGPAMMVNELSQEYAAQAQVIIGGTLPAAISYTEGELQERMIQRKVDIKDNNFLNHHVIQGNAVLPVVNAVGWMTNTCEQLYPDFRIHKVKKAQLFKGIVFDGNQEDNYTVGIKELQKDTDTLILETTVLSQAEHAKLPTYHYKATVMMISKKHQAKALYFEAKDSGQYQAKSGRYLYQNGALFHDHYFQGIESIVDWNEQQMILKCKAPIVPVKDQGQFPVLGVNTFFADIQYQGMVVWVQAYHNGAKSLPLATDACTIYESIPFDKELYVHIKIVESTEFKLVASCTVYDEQGKIYMLTENAAVTISQDLSW